MGTAPPRAPPDAQAVESIEAPPSSAMRNRREEVMCGIWHMPCEAPASPGAGSVLRVLTVRLRDQTGYSGKRSATTVLSVEHMMVAQQARPPHHVPCSPHHQTLADCGLSLLNSDHYTQSDARIQTTEYRVLSRQMRKRRDPKVPPVSHP